MDRAAVGQHAVLQGGPRRRSGFNTGISESPITPVIVGDGALAMTLSDRLFDEGVFAQGIGFPTVPRGKARVRTIVTATHTEESSSSRWTPSREWGASWESSERADSDRKILLAHERPTTAAPDRRSFFEAYTRGLTTADLERLFTRDAPEAYRFFSRNIDFDELKNRPWHLRMLGDARLLFLAFTIKLTPARRDALRQRAGREPHRPDRAVSELSPVPRFRTRRSRRARCGCSPASCS